MDSLSVGDQPEEIHSLAPVRRLISISLKHKIGYTQLSKAHRSYLCAMRCTASVKKEDTPDHGYYHERERMRFQVQC